MLETLHFKIIEMLACTTTKRQIIYKVVTQRGHKGADNKDTQAEGPFHRINSSGIACRLKSITKRRGLMIAERQT